MPGNNVLVKLDMQNAFNTVRRDNFLEVCSSIAPSILRLALTAYATSSHLLIGNETILSETDVQQGNPLGQVLFALAVDEAARDTNGSCLFAAGLPADIVGSQNFQTFSTRQTPHFGD